MEYRGQRKQEKNERKTAVRKTIERKIFRRVWGKLQNNMKYWNKFKNWV